MYVYVLRSKSHREQTYVGVTPVMGGRVAFYGSGKSPEYVRYAPWGLEGFFWFAEESKALTFESYLKSSKGKAFCRRYF